MNIVQIQWTQINDIWSVSKFKQQKYEHTFQHCFGPSDAANISHGSRRGNVHHYRLIWPVVAA